MENEEKINIPDEVRQAMNDGNPTSKSSSSSKSTTGFSQQTDTVQKIEYPSEVVDLPSKGWFYDPSSPLASGKIDI